MNARSFSLSIIIPTKNRELTLGELLESLRGAANIGAIRPEVIVANNGSDDGTDDFTANAAKDFPITLRVLSVVRPGKSAAINDAVKAANGDVFAFLDDDVIVDKNWLTAVDDFFEPAPSRRDRGPSGCKHRPRTIRISSNWLNAIARSRDSNTRET